MREILRQKLAEVLELEVPKLTRRSTVYVPEIPGKAKAVIGMRRAGKTSFLWQKIGEARAAGTGAERLVYFSFEDERIAKLKAEDLSLILEEYYRRYPEFRGRELVTFFFDEIQWVEGWERFARRILDSEKVDLYVSGSSARLLSREVATSMRGRAVEAVVYPFSFAECLRHAGHEVPEDPAFLSARQRSWIERSFREYLLGGGFPEAQGVSLRDRRLLLQGYVDIVILRDIAERHGLTNLPAIRWLVRQLLANAGGPFSANRFHKDLKSQKIRASVEGLLEVYAHLEDSFLIHGVRIEAGSERKRQVNPVKTYPIDPGLIAAFDRTGRENLGHALENAVLIELLRRGAEVTWVRTPGGYEVDFLARFPGGETELIQAVAWLDDPGVVEREVRGLVDAASLFPAAKLRVLTLDEAWRSPVPRRTDMELSGAAEWILSG